MEEILKITLNRTKENTYLPKIEIKTNEFEDVLMIKTLMEQINDQIKDTINNENQKLFIDENDSKKE